MAVPSLDRFFNLGVEELCLVQPSEALVKVISCNQDYWACALLPLWKIEYQRENQDNSFVHLPEEGL
jgi:hypothetical protein